ncbi:hypothetical protein ATANTOWER_028921 [Ataeniobius toweri]|uniref:Uncharacterized protein n=1 Tax=Ataeniobius toweri TaxID=208326 RepID=A0ABU7B0H6_9TELE|nr:hypothetical protein [Ataeniobius toweri]
MDAPAEAHWCLGSWLVQRFSGPGLLVVGSSRLVLPMGKNELGSPRGICAGNLVWEWDTGYLHKSIRHRNSIGMVFMWLLRSFFRVVGSCCTAYVSWGSVGPGVGCKGEAGLWCASLPS